MVGAILLSLGMLARSDPPAAVTAADEAFRRIDYPAAASAYEAVLRDMPDDPDLLWRLARVYVCMAEVEEGELQAAHLKKAEAYALECIRIAPGRSEGHTWRAAALGYIALGAGVSEQIPLSYDLVTEANEAIRLNPSDDAAYSILGSFYRALGNVGWLKRRLAGLFIGTVPEGGFEQSEAALKRAVEIAPEIMRHQYELGVLYMDLKRYDEAERCFQTASKLPVMVAIDRPRLKKIESWLEEIANLRK